MYSPLTEEKLVLIHDIPNAKVHGTKDENKRLYDAVQERHREYQDGLGIYDAVVYHRRGVEFRKV